MNAIKEKSFVFAVRVVKLARHLREDQREFVLSKQVLRAGTAVGALYREAEHAESTLDFIHKLAIAQKEANETLYWIELLHASDYLEVQAYSSIHQDAEQLLKLLTSIIKSTKAKLHS